MSDQRNPGFQRSDGVRSNYIPHLPSDLASAYAKFNASLTPEQRAALGAHPSNPTGEIRPLNKSDEYTTSEPLRALLSQGDDSTLPRGGVMTEAILHTDPEPVDPSQLASKPQHLHLLVVHTILRRVLRIFECASEPATRLHGDVVAIALGIPGYSVGSVARTYGVTRQAVSKRLRRVISHLGLPPTERMAIAGLDYTRQGKAPRKARGRLSEAVSDSTPSPTPPPSPPSPQRGGDAIQPKTAKPGNTSKRQSGATVGHPPAKRPFGRNRAGKQG